ncbi:MAG: histidine phosphatase family protein [Caldilinea sp.]
MALLRLITHAHTLVDPVSDATQWRLSTAGQSQAEALALLPFWAGIDRILVSSEVKTHLTVAPILATLQIPVSVDGRFDEVVRPSWVDEYGAHVKAFFAEPERSVGGWEPATHALQRFLAGLAAQGVPGSNEQVALVSHGLVLSLYRAHLTGKWPPDFEAWRQLGFGSVALVDLRSLTLVEEFTPVVSSPLRG